MTTAQAGSYAARVGSTSPSGSSSQVSPVVVFVSLPTVMSITRLYVVLNERVPVHAIGGTYEAAVNLPPSPNARIELALEVATNGSAVMLVRAVTYQKPQKASPGIRSPFPAFAETDRLLATLDWGPAF